ncbi:MAG TPA: glutaredoxin family protein [bacterium]|nr:glutaredoxin family protein [bacterium]HOL48016.1 glutaredoxin family protein [bacterium]HPQ19318.1 glutaredoxin family protein [bacterium]
MLNVYAANWCPHCKKTIKYLEEHNIPYKYFEIEEQPEEVIKKVVEVNGGEDWVVPTLEYNGKWREGKKFNEKELEEDLRKLGVI